jgi:hypothetical protein
MAKPERSKRPQQAEKPDDGMREKMVAVNRVTKVVKGGRILGSLPLLLLVTAMAVLVWVRESLVKFLLRLKKQWMRLAVRWLRLV